MNEASYIIRKFLCGCIISWVASLVLSIIRQQNTTKSQMASPRFFLDDSIEYHGTALTCLIAYYCYQFMAKLISNENECLVPGTSVCDFSLLFDMKTTYIPTYLPIADSFLFLFRKRGTIPGGNLSSRLLDEYIKYWTALICLIVATNLQTKSNKITSVWY